MNLEIIKAEDTGRQLDESHLDFGVNFTEHMFTMDYNPKDGWHNAKIEPFSNFSMSPASMVFHYAQSAFEGMKAYKYKGDQIGLLRPEKNFERMNRSCEKLVMPKIDEKFVMESLKELIKIDSKWVPSSEGTALYIRPTIMGFDPIVRLKPSDTYKFFIIMSPVGKYYKNGFKPAKILVEENFVRAAMGGTGDVKAAANYAMSLKAGKEAGEKGYDQALWLDAKERRYIEEVGSMNLFFVKNGIIITPKLRGTVLPGITRDSVITLAKNMGYTVEERDIAIDEVLESVEDGSISECFGSGTAAVISPVGTIGFRGKDIIINNAQVGEISQRIYDEYVGIQYGEKEDIFNWITIV